MVVGKVPVDFFLVPNQNFFAAVAADFRFGPQKAPDNSAQVGVVHDVFHLLFFFSCANTKKKWTVPKILILV